MRRRRKHRIALLIAAALVVAALAAIGPRLPAIMFLWSMADGPDTLQRLATADGHVVGTRDIDIPTRHGSIRARVYATTPASSATVLVVPGVHAGGVDEPRQARFSRQFAAAGVTVVVAPLPDLREFRLTATSTDQIEDAVQWLSSRPSIAPAGVIGLFGVSFAGGLAIAAAGRPAIGDRLQVVLSLGGYGDFGRVLQYLCSGRLPDGRFVAPHDYGVAMAALAAGPWMVPPDQVAPLDRGIRLYLEAAFDTSETQAEAARLVAAARAQAEQLPDPAGDILRAVVRRDVARVGEWIAPAIDALAANPALSPERSPPPRVPVFLVHGPDDTVIPSSETLALAAHLRRQRSAPVHALLTPVLSHVGIQSDASLLDYWRLARFWERFRDELEP
jgi:dienelactone hydrolase